MKKIIKSKKLKKLEIEVKHNGFTIWITENCNGNKIEHLLIDGSKVKINGCIQLCKGLPQYKFSTEYDESNNEIRLVKK